MNVTLSNDDYAKLAEQARSQGQLTEELAANLIRESI
jgi:hypothetical protein